MISDAASILLLGELTLHARRQLEEFRRLRAVEWLFGLARCHKVSTSGALGCGGVAMTWSSAARRLPDMAVNIARFRNVTEKPPWFLIENFMVMFH